MSGFEFVLVLYAVIIGSATSEIITGIADQIKARHRLAPYPSQLILAMLLLYSNIAYLWVLWTFRNIDWSFQLYLLLLLFPLVMALCSRFMKVDTSLGALSNKAQYFSNAAPTYIALALIPALVVITSFTSMRESVENPLDLAYITPIRVLAMLGMLFLAWSKNETVHRIGVIALFVFIVMVSSRLSVDTIGGAT